MKKKIFNLILILLIVSCSSDDDNIEYAVDCEIIIEDLIEDKTDFLNNLFNQKIDDPKNTEKIDINLQFKSYLLLESSYLDELNSLKESNNTSVKFIDFELNKINELQINDSANTIITRLDQPFYEAFLWESLFDLVFVIFLEFILIVIVCIILFSILFNKENARFLPETEGCGCFSIPMMLFVGTLLFAIFVRPAERIGLVSSSRDKEINKQIENIIEEDLVILNETMDYNIKLIQE